MADTPRPIALLPLEVRPTRRGFIKGVAASAVGVVAFTGCAAPPGDMQAQSRVRMAEDVVGAYDQWYATACRGCGAGCGVLVRVVDGRAKKVEGNPDHPVNRGKLCARGQAIVQEQYHPDRVRGPQRRRERPGDFAQANWDDALGDLAGRLSNAPPGSVAVVTGRLDGAAATAVRQLADALGARLLVLDPRAEAPLREAARRSLGLDGLPYPDLARTRYVLSFGADLLGGWLSPVRLNVDYGLMRHGSYRPGTAFAPSPANRRGTLVQVEPRFSVTAANADRWVPVTPGGEGPLALAIGQVMLREGLGDPAAAGALGAAADWDAFAPERVSPEVGVAPDDVRALARAFATTRPSLAIGGGAAAAHTNGTAALGAVMALNRLVGAVGREGGLLASPPPPAGLPGAEPPSPLRDWAALVDDLRAGRVQTVLVYDADPLHALPKALGLEVALQGGAFVASFSSFADDTTSLANLVLPASLPLESWGVHVPDPSPGATVVTLQQPILESFFDTRPFVDVLAELATRLGKPLPFASAEEAVQTTAQALAKLDRGSVRAAEPERFLVQLRQRGGWWDESAAAPAPAAPGDLAGLTGGFPRAQIAGDPAQFPYYLLPYVHNTLGAGEAAHLPWLQATPDPITSAVWRSWVEVNPRLAAQLGLKEGDEVALESPTGRVELPVYVNPAAPPNVLAVPMGQGHRGYGRWAQGRGVNVLDLVAPQADEATGALAYAATRVRMTKTGRRTPLPKLEGTVEARQLTDNPVVKVTGRKP